LSKRFKDCLCKDCEFFRKDKDPLYPDYTKGTCEVERIELEFIDRIMHQMMVNKNDKCRIFENK